jgi:ribosomal protein L37AE/L43A
MKQVPKDFAEAFAKALVGHLCPKCGSEMCLEDYRIFKIWYCIECGHEEKVKE